MNIKIGL